jgi:hypothetical protein
MQEIKPMATPLPSGYAELGVTTGFNPIPPEKTRQVILGPEGSGKSYFALGIPRNLILDFEQGTRHMPSPRAHYIKITNYDSFLEIIKKVCEDGEKGTCPFDRITFDTVDQWVDVTARYMGQQMNKEDKESDIRYWGKEGAGYSRLNNNLFGVIKRLEVAGLAWTAICHISEKDITVNENRRTVARPSVHPGFYRLLAQNSEVIAMICTEKQVKETMRVYNGKAIPTGKMEEYFQFVMKAANSGAMFGNTNNKVRLPDFEETILLPNPMEGKYGWDLFCEKYNEHVTSIKTRLNPPTKS